MNETSNEEKYPSVTLAYELSHKSYDWAIERLNSADDKIDRLIVWIASMTLGFIALVGSGRKLSELSYDWWFVTAMISFIAIICIGLYIRHHGSLILVSSNKMIKWVHESEWEFKKNRIYFAGEHFKKNIRLVKKKYMCTNVLIILFVFEIFCLIKWLIH